MGMLAMNENKKSKRIFSYIVFTVVIPSLSSYAVNYLMGNRDIIIANSVYIIATIISAITILFFCSIYKKLTSKKQKDNLKKITNLIMQLTIVILIFLSFPFLDHNTQQGMKEKFSYMALIMFYIFVSLFVFHLNILIEERKKAVSPQSAEITISRESLGIKSDEQAQAVSRLINVGNVKGLWTHGDVKKRNNKTINSADSLTDYYLDESRAVRIKHTRGTDLVGIQKMVSEGKINDLKFDELLNNEDVKKSRLYSTILKHSKSNKGTFSVSLLLTIPCRKSEHLKKRLDLRNIEDEEKRNAFFSSSYYTAKIIEELNRNYASKGCTLICKFYLDQDAKWRYYLCDLPNRKPGRLLLSAYSGENVDGEELDIYEIHSDGSRISNNLYAYMNKEFEEIWDNRSMTLSDFEKNIFLGCKNCRKCNISDRRYCMEFIEKTRLIQNNSDIRECYIAEISGKDSLAAVVRFMDSAFANKKYVRIIPTVALTGTEISRTGDILELYYDSIYSLKCYSERLNEKNAYIKFEMLQVIQDYSLWTHLCSTWTKQVGYVFPGASPCITCHLYLHLLRVPLYIRESAVGIITGERYMHEDTLKSNQQEKTLDIYQEIFNSYDNDRCKLLFERPIVTYSEDQNVEDLLLNGEINRASSNIDCIVRDKPNSRIQSQGDKRCKEIEDLNDYLIRYVKPLGEFVLNNIIVPNNKLYINERNVIDGDALARIDQKIQELINEGEKCKDD